MNDDLGELPLVSFLEQLADATPAPGGGSVAALAGATGAALIEMVAGISLAKAAEEARPRLEVIREEAQRLRSDLTALIDRDSRAYQAVVSAFRLPKDQADRRQKIQDAFWEATQTPLETLAACRRGEALAGDLQPIALESAMSDLKVARTMLQAGVEGARENVLINLPSLKDEERRLRVQERLAELLPESRFA